MTVPVDPDAGVGESFITSIPSDVVIHFAFVVFCELFGARHPSFFLGRKDKHKITFRLDLCSIKCADCCQQRLDISSVVTYAGRIDFSILDRGLDLQARLEDRIHVCIKHDNWATTGAATSRYQVAGRVVTYLEFAFAP